MSPTALTKLARAYGYRNDLFQAATAWMQHYGIAETNRYLAAFVDRFVGSAYLKNSLQRNSGGIEFHAHGQLWSLATRTLSRAAPSWDFSDKKLYPVWEPLGLSYHSFAHDVAHQLRKSQSHWKNEGPRLAPLSLVTSLTTSALNPATLAPLLAFLDTKTIPNAGALADLLGTVGATWVEAKQVEADTVLQCWKALADQGLSDADIAALWYDPAVDTRQKSANLVIQLKILPQVVKWFRERDPGLVAKVMRITRDFLRLTGQANSKNLAKVLKTFQEFWYLDLAEWVEEGAKLIRLHGDTHVKVLEWFDRKSQGSQDLWRSLDTAIHFEQAQESSELFLTGLLERPITLVPDSRGGFWTDNLRVGLPDHYGPTQSRDTNQMLWRHSCAHEAAHILYGSFDRSVSRYQETIEYFRRLFPDLYEERKFDIPRVQGEIADAFRAWGNTMGFRVEVDDLFGPETASHLTLMLHAPRVLEAKFLHNVFEDWRIEALLYRDFGGLAKERAEKDKVEDGLREVTLAEEGHEALVEAVFLKVLYNRDPKGRHAWDAEWKAIRALIERFQSRATDVWDSWMVTAEVCALVDQFYKTTNPQDWDLSRDVPFQLILESVNLLIRQRNGDRPSPKNETLKVSEETRKAAGILGENMPPELSVLLATISKQQTDPNQRQTNSRFGTLPRDGKAGRTEFLDEIRTQPLALFPYPEWSYEKADYLADHCIVGEYAPEALAGKPFDLVGTLGTSAASLQKAFQKIRPQAWTDRRNEEDGDEWDFDALFDGMMEFRAGNAWEQDFYIHRERRTRDVVTALLLDVSSSTRELDENFEKTLFRREQEAAYLLGQALAGLGDRFGVFGSLDFGAATNIVLKIKDFDTPWDRKAIAHLEALTPPERGFSRMAPPLRHLTARLRQREAKTKVIFFITDGMPLYIEEIIDEGETSADIVVDGIPRHLPSPVSVVSLTSKPDRWAEEDLRKVVEEAQLAGVHLFGVNLNARAQPFMEKVFGRRALYVPEAKLLAPRLLEVFRKVTL